MLDLDNKDRQVQSAIVPIVLEQNRQMDLYSRMLKDRIVFLTGEVNNAQAELIVSQLLYLESENPDEPITLYINSGGGSVTAGFAIYDAMQFIKCPVHTLCTGMAASMAAFLLSAGDRGHRYALPHSRIMIHQPLGGTSGQQTDIQIYAENIAFFKSILEHRLAEHCRKPYQQVSDDCNRDKWMSAEDCVDYGLIDSILPYRNPSIDVISLRDLVKMDNFDQESLDKYKEEQEAKKEKAKKASKTTKDKAKSKDSSKTISKTVPKSSKLTLKSTSKATSKATSKPTSKTAKSSVKVPAKTK